MADPARLSLADQALIHLLGYLATENIQDDTWSTFRACLSEILPQVNRGRPILEELAGYGDRILAPIDREDLLSALHRAERAIANYHKSRAARAIDELRALAKGDAA